MTDATRATRRATRTHIRTPLETLGRRAALAGARLLPPGWIEWTVHRLMGERLGLFRTAWTVALHHPQHLHLPRFDAIALDQMVRWAGSRFPVADRFLLTDVPVDELPYRFDRLGVTTLDRPHDAPPSLQPRVFFCAYACDDRLAGVLHEIQAMDNAFYYTPKSYLPTARIFHRDPAARDVLQALMPPVDDVDTWDLADYENIIQALAQTRDLPGAAVEIGVYRGASAELTLAYLERAGIVRHCWLLDLFEGFTYEEARTSADAFWAGQFSSTSLPGVAERLARFPNKTLARCNIISDELPDGIDRIAVCNIDVDMYEAVIAALEKTADRMVPGGVILVEDQGHTPNIAGGFLAVRDFLAGPHGRRFLAWNLTSGQALLVRK
ncbi:MAG: TylF/MycF/NovP-related O-methyltransferase [Candidatus Krumholzibacteriia bacterium]